MTSLRTKMLLRAVSAAVWVFGSAIVLTVLAYQGCQSWETPRSYYADLQEARFHGAVEHGWIPAILPESARHIQEWHDIDTNEGQIRFQFDPADGEGFLSQLTVEGGDTLYRDPTSGTIFYFTVDAEKGQAKVWHR